MLHWTRSTGTFVILAICGCSVAPREVQTQTAAPPDIQSQTATPAYSTAKGPELFAECLANAFGPVEAIRFGARASIKSKSGLELGVSTVAPYAFVGPLF